jgi:hypothetical protein
VFCDPMFGCQRRAAALGGGRSRSRGRTGHSASKRDLRRAAWLCGDLDRTVHRRLAETRPGGAEPGELPRSACPGGRQLSRTIPMRRRSSAAPDLRLRLVREARIDRSAAEVGRSWVLPSPRCHSEPAPQGSGVTRRWAKGDRRRGRGVEERWEGERGGIWIVNEVGVLLVNCGR